MNTNANGRLKGFDRRAGFAPTLVLRTISSALNGHKSSTIITSRSVQSRMIGFGVQRMLPGPKAVSFLRVAAQENKDRLVSAPHQTHFNSSENVRFFTK